MKGETRAAWLDLFPRLQDQYTAEDNGTLVGLSCMNYMKLKAGEAVYVPQDRNKKPLECIEHLTKILTNSGFRDFKYI